MSPSGALTVVVSVSTIKDRDELVNRIYTNLTKEPDTSFTVIKDQVNRVRVFHNAEHSKVLIKTYLVVMVPVIMNLDSMSGVYGNVDFHLDETIKFLGRLIGKLKTMQGRRYIKGADHTEDLVRILKGM